MSPPVLFLTLAEVVEIQRDQVTRYGGEAGKDDAITFFRAHVHS